MFSPPPSAPIPDPETNGHALDAAARIKSNYEKFSEPVDAAERLLSAGRLDEAAMCISVAAGIAARVHCGVFTNSRLERMLHDLSAATADKAPPLTGPKSANGVRRVLHVATETSFVGGLTRMIGRWSAADATRTNSLLLTRQHGAVPTALTEAIETSGGELHRLNTTNGTALDWVRRLRIIARDYDLVVLHIHCEDVIPLIAFARPETVPPVLFLNHADHLFWLGSSVGRAVINLRDAASDITIDRRGVAPERSLLLPTIVDKVQRRRSREEARKALNLPQDGVLMVSVARTPKYKTIHGTTFADRHVELLKRHPAAYLVVVGAGAALDWKPAQDAVAGRIIPLPEHPDPSTYFEAADIYVDSYPFVSSTSLMEAAGYGLPLVSLFTAPDEARIVGINHVGLVGPTLVATTAKEYEDTLTRLITEPSFREHMADAALNGVINTHQPAAWLGWLEGLYETAANLPQSASPPAGLSAKFDEPCFGELDCRHQDMFGSNLRIGEDLKAYIPSLPVVARIRAVGHLLKAGEIASPLEAAKLLIPEWVKRRIKP
jgi:hypothetical protein